MFYYILTYLPTMQLPRSSNFLGPSQKVVPKPGSNLGHSQNDEHEPFKKWQAQAGLRLRLITNSCCKNKIRWLAYFSDRQRAVNASHCPNAVIRILVAMFCFPNPRQFSVLFSIERVMSHKFQGYFFGLKPQMPEVLSPQIYGHHSTWNC